MANTYNWTINKLDVRPTQDSLSNVVYNIHWGYTATSDQTDADGNAYSATNIGVQIVSTPDPSNFTAFESLTQADVEGWLEASDLDVAGLKASLDLQIEKLITPDSVALDAPWLV